MQIITSVGENVVKLEPSYTAGGKAKWYNSFGTKFDSSSKSYTQSYHMAINSSPRNLPGRTENTCPRKNLNTNVCSSITCTSQKVEMTQMPINLLLDGEKNV